jgi:hypothetical protein
MISPEQVAQALPGLAERPAVRLRVPVGDLAEHVIAARDAAPYHQPLSVPSSGHRRRCRELRLAWTATDNSVTGVLAE